MNPFNIPTPEAYELEPAVAWDIWDAAVQQLEQPSPTTSPAFARMVERAPQAPWLVGARP